MLAHNYSDSTTLLFYKSFNIVAFKAELELETTD